ncbi:MAG: sulfurtransferase TusA family protein [Ezakiella sp.]|nr:sulfurtransferase TusA family protein [Ezakiella sp.]MDD7761385.1 sulfurtransferase TusA family protein [Bacillota bacterium]MDY3946927.1 sulfurtransferase TusA family protein [Ezakiella sp.]
MKKIDARGLSCPEPVVLAKNAVDASEKQIEITVDAQVSKENVSRFLENAGYKLSVKESGDDFIINATK